MFSLKPLVAAVTLGTAMLMAPGVANAVVTHRSSAATHTIKHKGKKHAHKRVHRKHSSKHAALSHTGIKHASLATRGVHATKTVSLKSGSRHHPM